MVLAQAHAVVPRVQAYRARATERRNSAPAVASYASIVFKKRQIFFHEAQHTDTNKLAISELKDEVIIAEWLESMQKYIECTFENLKSRFRILKNTIRLKFEDDIEALFRTCTVFHNILLQFDSLFLKSRLGNPFRWWNPLLDPSPFRCWNPSAFLSACLISIWICNDNRFI